MDTSQDFSHLLSPMQIGPLRTRNRIVGAPHGTNLGEDNLVSDANVAYYREKARGGAAIIITESMRVHPTALPYAGAMALYDPRNESRLPRIPQVVHDEGGVVFAQLNHAGRNMKPGYSGLPLWSPSPLASPMHAEIAHEMDEIDIEDIVRGFADSARRAIDAGFDGVEIHGAHGYLIQQFLSPWCNERHDEYGGSLDNRVRFALAVVSAVRAAVPAKKVVGIRISAEEWIAEGIHLDEMSEVARRIAASGGVDYIHVSTSTYHPDSYPNQIPDMHQPMAPFVHHAAAIKAAIKNHPVAVFAVGRIHDPHVANRVIASGQADMIAMARQLIADPHWPRKVAEGRIEELRSCIACNQGCIGRVATQSTIRCVVNPTAGREKEWGSWTLPMVAKPGHIVVVGGGPAGLEAARVAALRGHRVTLFEKEARVGGQINDAVLAPGRSDYGKLVLFLAREVRRLEVDVKLSTSATVQSVLALEPTAVVLATGATPAALPVGAIRTLDAVEALRQVSNRQSPPPRHALIVDEIGQFQAYGLAEALAAAGTRVELVTSKAALRYLVPNVSLIPLQKRLRKAGVQIHVATSVVEITGSTVRMRSSLHDGEFEVTDVDLIVRARAPVPQTQLVRELRTAMKPVFVIGDCAAPRGALEAMSEGHRVGREV